MLNPEHLARSRIKPLWQEGDLFHISTRRPHGDDRYPVDRLARILEKGLLAPAHCPEGLVRQTVQIRVEGGKYPYDSLVFLHRFGPISHRYTLYERGRFSIFLDPGLPLLTYEDMGEHWMLLCPDEVYVHGSIPSESFRGLAVHPDDAESVLAELGGELCRLGIPLFAYGGRVVWPTP